MNNILTKKNINLKLKNKLNKIFLYISANIKYLIYFYIKLLIIILTYKYLTIEITNEINKPTFF